MENQKKRGHRNRPDENNSVLFYIIVHKEQKNHSLKNNKQTNCVQNGRRLDAYLVEAENMHENCMSRGGWAQTNITNTMFQ